MEPAALSVTDPDPSLDRRSIGAVLNDQSNARGAAPALYWLDVDGRLQTLSYRSLYAAAVALATQLRTAVPPQSRVAVWSANSPGWVVLEYASALAGTILTPINPALTDREVLAILEQSGARRIYVGETHRGSDLLSRAHRLASGRGLDVRALAEVPFGCAAPEAAAADLPKMDSSAVFLLQYTSGTTGRPKGVVLTQSAAYNSARLSAERLGLTETDTWVCPLPLHHVGGSVCILLPMLAAGGAVALASGWDVDHVVALIAASRATVLGAVPTMMIDLAEHPGAEDGSLASLRIVQGGGSTVAPSLIRRVEKLLGVAVVVAYGQSEAPVCIAGRLDDSAEDKATTIGTPLPHREVRIVDPETGLLAAVGEVGELQIRSELSMTGYWQDPEATATAIDGDNWLHTGDLCSCDARGMLRIHGRHRDLIIRGGENIYPAEVEEVLLSHPAIHDVALVGSPSDRWGEEPVAFVRLETGMTASADELDAWTRDRMAAFKRPRKWYFVDTFPLTASGKVQKFILRRQLG